jgi:hypothetical protein
MAGGSHFTTSFLTTGYAIIKNWQFALQTPTIFVSKKHL